MKTELFGGEPHPMAPVAFQLIKAQGVNKLMLWRESLASTALSGSRTSEICLATLERILNGQPVSDRYVLGLAWLMFSEDIAKVQAASPEKLSQ